METENYPLVSIGLPVFNGARGLAEALDALLGQDYPNFEIIISDNASTDSSPDICKKYIQKDSRIKYGRSEKNLGGPWNFSRVFELSSGKYFMWAAYDDKHHKSFVSECVKKMEQCPDAALVHVICAVKTEESEELSYYTNINTFEGVTGLPARYRETLEHLPATAIYGLFRSSLVRKTHLFEKVIASDQIFLQELSLYGTFVQVSKVLWTYFQKAEWNSIDEDYSAYFGKNKKPWWYLPFVCVFLKNWKNIMTSDTPLFMKFGLWAVLIRHQISYIILKLFIRTAGFLCPGKYKEKLGAKIYWRWICCSNIQPVGNFYFERIIKPRLGWWR